MQPADARTEEERKNWETITARVNAFLAQGTPPDEVGEMVLAGVKANRLYIHTDRIMARAIEALAKALLDAMPPARSGS